VESGQEKLDIAFGAPRFPSNASDGLRWVAGVLSLPPTQYLSFSPATATPDRFFVSGSQPSPEQPQPLRLSQPMAFWNPWFPPSHRYVDLNS
jgi:hypothetical protein